MGALGFLSLGKLLMAGGLTLTGIGALVWLIGRSGFNGLPGDIRYSRGSFTLFFPIVTSIALSILLTIILNVIARLRH
jgi:hypothetical protein